VLAAAVHAAVFVAILYLLSNVVEGFASDPCIPVACTVNRASCSIGCNISGNIPRGTCDKNLICKTPSVTPGTSYYATTDDVKKAQRAPFTGNDTTKTVKCGEILKSLKSKKSSNNDIILKMKNDGCYDYAIQNVS
jgi:hypothetical protein